MALEPLTLMERRPAREIVADALRGEILSASMPPGFQLRQDEIAKNLGVSQATVREAFRSLEAERLVTSFPNRGVFVAQISIEEIEELYDLRACLEALALRHNFPALDGDRLQEARVQLEKSDVSTEFSFLGARNRSFHSVFYSSASRKTTTAILDSCFGNLTRQWVSFIRERPNEALEYERASRLEHRAILEASVAGDETRAIAALQSHIAHARETMLRYLNQVRA